MKTFVKFAASLFLLLSSPLQSFGSSNSVDWNYFSSSQGARITATRVRSFLGSDEVSRVILFSGVCNPNQPTPYITAVMTPRDGVTPPSANLKVLLENGNYLFLGGSIDRIATANAGDQRIRYGLNLPTASPFFKALIKENSRYYPRIDLDPNNGGANLEITNRHRQKVRDFLAACNGFAGNNPTAVNAEPPHACRDYLNGPNAYAGNQARSYSKEIVDGVCGSLRMDVRPAVCMHYIMGGNLAWDLNGNTSWQEDNAAALCYQNTNVNKRISCFSNEIAKGNDWYVGINVCNEVN